TISKPSIVYGSVPMISCHSRCQICKPLFYSFTSLFTYCFSHKVRMNHKIGGSSLSCKLLKKDLNPSPMSFIFHIMTSVQFLVLFSNSTLIGLLATGHQTEVRSEENRNGIIKDESSF
ncbi:MAG: hypothetical protein RIC90_14140, partial [Balneola sp.]